MHRLDFPPATRRSSMRLKRGCTPRIGKTYSAVAGEGSCLRQQICRWSTLTKRGPGPVLPLVRLCLVFGPILVAIALFAQIKIHTRSVVASAPEFLPPAAVAVQSSPERSNLSPANSDFTAATRLMIPAPPDAEPALQVVAPQMLRASFQRGVAAMQRNSDDEAASEGARLVNMTAALGYEPARSLITREYPRSQAIRSAVSATDVVRYSLDPLIVAGRQSEANRTFLILLAAYFSGHQMIVAYAGDVLRALSDDRRLQTSDRLQILLVDLSHIPGACTALARAVVKARMVTGPECSSRLQLQIDHYLRVTSPAGDEAASRHQAMALLRGATEQR